MSITEKLGCKKVLTFGGQKDAGAALKQEWGEAGPGVLGRRGLDWEKQGSKWDAVWVPQRGCRCKGWVPMLLVMLVAKGHQLLSAKLDFGS